jgi:hypothetical protein
VGALLRSRGAVRENARRLVTTVESSVVTNGERRGRTRDGVVATVDGRVVTSAMRMRAHRTVLAMLP